MNRKKVEKKLSQIKNISFFPTDSFYLDTLKGIEEALEKKTFKIAIVGEFSTGKSTFINALIGRDLLLHATEEVTAAITNIYNVSVDSDKWHTCDVVFDDGTIKHLEDDSLLIDYTTTKSQVTDVINTIKMVDYYTDYSDPSLDMVIVDTPGLNGMADGHRELTLQEVKHADFCIYLVGIRGLAETDKTILKEMPYYQKNFVFVINFIDQLKISEGETVKERIDEIRDFLDDDVFSEYKINYEIFGVSALKALAGKDKSIKRLYQGDVTDIEDSERGKLYEESRIKSIEDYIIENVNNSTIDKLTVERVGHMIVNMLDTAVDDLEQRQKQIEYLRGTDSDFKKIQSLEERKKFFLESGKRNKERVLNYAESECGAIRREYMEYLRNALGDLYSKYVGILSDFNKYEELEEYIKSNQLDAQVKVDADIIYDYVEDSMLKCLNDVLNNILVRIQEYLKDSQINPNAQKITFEITKGIKRSDEDILAAKSILGETKRMEEDARQRASTAKILYEKEIKAQKDNLQRVDNAHRNLQQAKQNKERRLAQLGSKPAVETKTTYIEESYTDYVYRGGWGIVDSLFGPKKVTKTRQVPHTYKDDSRQKAWRKERDKIISSCNPEIERLQRELDIGKNQILSAEKMVKKSQMDVELAQEDLKFYQEKYKADKKVLENLKQKANQELLNSLRNSIISQLEAYCDFDEGKIACVIKEYVDSTIEINRKIICEKTAEFYENRLNSMVNIYQSEIEGKSDLTNKKYDNYKRLIVEIKKIREELYNAE